MGRHRSLAQDLMAGQPSTKRMDIKSTGVAIVLSLVWTGLGQVYAGRIGRGLTMMIVTPMIWSMAAASGSQDTAAGLLTTTRHLLGSVETTVGTADVSMGGVLGILGMTLWLVLGMVDAKRQCVISNQKTLRLAN
jgi:TM2 domain-containing membrane protein YozV